LITKCSLLIGSHFKATTGFCKASHRLTTNCHQTTIPALHFSRACFISTTLPPIPARFYSPPISRYCARVTNELPDYRHRARTCCRISLIQPFHFAIYASVNSHAFRTYVAFDFA
jgi:hypothetical protein